MESIIGITDNIVITFEGLEYPARYVANGALISVERLGEVLMTEDGSFKNEIAEHLDNNICGFVSDEEFNLSDGELEIVCRDYGMID